MRILRLKCVMRPESLRPALDGLDAVAVRPGIAESVEEFELAHHLAKNAYEKKTNIARKLRYEFLLWLSGKTDIRSAMDETSPREGEDTFFAVVFSDAEQDAVRRKLGAESLPLSLRKKGEPLALERISLSRAK